MAVSDRITAPTVSIVIPMYNAEPFIGKMIDCILAQTYSDWELLVVDDGSTDTGKRIVAEYAAKDPRIKLMVRSEERTKGGNTCRNIGLENVAGEYVVFFDADDLIAPYCLEQRVDFISRHPELDFAIFPLTAFKKEPFDIGCIALGYKNSRHALSKLIRNLVPFQVVTNIYRKDSLLSRGIVWDEQLRSHQDPDFNILCLRSGMKFSESNLLPDYFWRIAGNPNSTGKKIYTPEHFKTNLYFFDKRAREFSAEAQHTADLLILSDYLYKVLVYQNNLQFVETFLSHGFFDRYAFLRRKLLFIGRMQSRHKFASRHVVNILLLLLCPAYEIRYRRAANIGWVRKQKKYFRELRQAAAAEK